MARSRIAKKTVHWLAVWGLVSTGIVYTAIGVIAILSFLRLKDGGADEGSLLVYLNNYAVGTVTVWIILVGMIGFVVWRVYETFFDPFEYGSDTIGIGRRAVILASSAADGLLAFYAIQVLLGSAKFEENGVPVALRQSVNEMLNNDWGNVAIMTIGVITIITALVQIGYAISRTYAERLDIDRLARGIRLSIHSLAWIGHLGRAIILGIIGYSFVHAALENDALFVVNTDKAFDFIGDNIGHVYFIAVAIATICYGFFMFAFGVFYDSETDKE